MPARSGCEASWAKTLSTAPEVETRRTRKEKAVANLAIFMVGFPIRMSFRSLKIREVL
jgi:hypothetical protein